MIFTPVRNCHTFLDLLPLWSVTYFMDIPPVYSNLITVELFICDNR